MKQAADLLKSCVVFAKVHKYYSIGAIVFLIAAITAITFLAYSRPGTKPSSIQKMAKISRTAASQQDGTAPGTVAAATSSTTQPIGTNTGKPVSSSTNAPAPAAAAQNSLTISPSAFTLLPGDSAPISITASNGAALNYPLINFTNDVAASLGPGSPAKPNWNGTVSALLGASAGTYTVNVFAQDKTKAYYYGSITVTVVQPTMELNLQPLGYDSDDNAVTYVIRLNRLYGFNESVTSVRAYSFTEPGLTCAYSIVDSDTIALACGHDDGTGPTSGNLTIEVRTASLSRTTAASYSLPR